MFTSKLKKTNFKNQKTTIFPHQMMETKKRFNELLNIKLQQFLMSCLSVTCLRVYAAS